MVARPRNRAQLLLRLMVYLTDLQERILASDEVFFGAFRHVFSLLFAHSGNSVFYGLVSETGSKGVTDIMGEKLTLLRGDKPCSHLAVCSRVHQIVLWL